MTSCSGGGGGGSGGSITTTNTSSPTPAAPLAPPPTDPSPTSAPSSAEVGRNYGLAAINAPAAYAAGSTGQGITVALIDSGIDTDHSEFTGRIHPQSTDIVSGSRANLNDTNGHGTHVAGIVGAAADRSGVVGVAPDSQLLAIRANARGDGISEDELLFFDADVANAINRAVSNGAQVINLSFGKLSSISDDYDDAIARAVANDVLIVAAAGNEPSGETTRPASFAGSGDARGRILAVGAVGRDENIASFSSQPGFTDLNESFLVAPGVDIRSTATGGGLGTRSGTSFATPHVTGAAAVLKSAFPSLTMRQVADLLLETAKDLGEPGPDPVYGQGLIDLDAALAPSGTLSIATGSTVDGGQASISNTELSLGAAFGDALTSSAALSSVMALDSYDRPYAVNLSNQVVQTEPSFGLDALLIDGPNAHTSSLPASIAGSQAGLAWRAEETRLWDRGHTGFRADDSPETSLNRFDFSGTNQEVSWRVGYGLGASTLLTSAPKASGSESLFWQSQSL
ncbi:MAG: S8 family serine peptidase, partial [Pseudomonadota bacterium]